MKPYTDKDTVDTRNNFVAGLVGSVQKVTLISFVFFALSLVSSCFRDNYENEPDDGTPVFAFGTECIVNGELLEHQAWPDYRWFEYRHGVYPFAALIAFKGLIREDNGSYGVDYSSFAFGLKSRVKSTTDSDSFYDLFFYIKGDGKGPFVAGKEYSSPENVATCYRGSYYWRSFGYIIHDAPFIHELYSPNLGGLEV